MEVKNLNEEVLISIYKNAHIALQSISDIAPETDHPEMKEELKEEYEGYEKFIGELSSYMKEKGVEPQDISPMKKAMLFTSVKMNTFTDDSKSHIAELMIKGTVMGITELSELLNANGNELSPEVKKFAETLKALEEEYEERLKKLL